jgi:hypothetical protein
LFSTLNFARGTGSSHPRILASWHPIRSDPDQIYHL